MHNGIRPDTSQPPCAPGSLEQEQQDSSRDGAKTVSNAMDRRTCHRIQQQSEEPFEPFMKFFTKLFAAAAVTAAAIASPAVAGEAGPYINVGIGTGFGTEVEGSISGIDFEADGRTTFGGGIGLGYDFGNNWRLEGNVSRSTSDVDSVTVGGLKYDVDESASGWGFGIDLEYDFPNDSKYTPYVGAGVGISRADDSDDNAYGFSVVAGVAYEANDTTDVYAEIGYGLSPEQDIDGVDYDASGEFGATIGLRFAL